MYVWGGVFKSKRHGGTANTTARREKYGHSTGDANAKQNIEFQDSSSHPHSRRCFELKRPRGQRICWRCRRTLLLPRLAKGRVTHFAWKPAVIRKNRRVYIRDAMTFLRLLQTVPHYENNTAAGPAFSQMALVRTCHHKPGGRTTRTPRAHSRPGSSTRACRSRGVACPPPLADNPAPHLTRKKKKKASNKPGSARNATNTPTTHAR